MKRALQVIAFLLSCGPAGALILDSGEWFIDNDPGFGSGVSFPVGGSTSASKTVLIPAAVIGEMKEGAHSLGVRFLDDNGQWGHTLWRSFYKQSVREDALMVSGEWFLNDDPGPGLGTEFSVPSEPSGSGVVTIPAARMKTLDEGTHFLGTRLRDNSGCWGHVIWRAFYAEGIPDVASPVGSFEYHIVQNDGEILNVTVPLAPPASFVNESVGHGKGGLQIGSTHQLQVIPLDSTGRRGHAVTVGFTYQPYVQAWKENHFSPAEQANPAISGDDKDPDKDGLTNLQERLFALNPRNTTDSALAAPGIGQQAGTGMTNRSARATVEAPWSLTFRVPGGGTVGEDGIYRTSDLRYTLRHNTDLGPWNSIPPSWITGWTLHDLEDGAARLQLDLVPSASGNRFFSLEGTR